MKNLTIFLYTFFINFLLQVRRPFMLWTELVPVVYTNHFARMIDMLRNNMENLKVVKFGKFIKLFKNSFPFEKFIRGLLPKNVDFSLDSEIRIDETYIKFLVELLRDVSIQDLADYFGTKVRQELNFLLFPGADRKFTCLNLASTYDYNFQEAMAKHFLSEEKKKLITKMIHEIVKTAIKFVENVWNKKKCKKIYIFIVKIHIEFLIFLLFLECKLRS